MENKISKIKQETNANFWREWWDSISDRIPSDHDLDRVSSVQDKEMEQITTQELLDFVSPEKHDTVFDAGCGTGLNISILHPKVKEIIGMDQSEKMIDRCKQRLIKENILNSRLMVGNVTNIGINSNTFDKILCMSVLHYLDEEECDKALKELVRISKKGTIIVFHVKNLSSLYLSTLNLAKTIKSLFSQNVIREHYRSYWWYEKKFNSLGIKILDYNSVNKFTIEFLPKFIFNKLRGIERKCYKNRFLRRFGADYKIKSTVIK